MTVVRSERLKIGVIGSGRMARIHLGNVFNHPRAELHSIVSANTTVVEPLTHQYHVPSRRLSDVLGDPACDAVIVTNRTEDHAKTIKAALQAGKHVFSEKPLCTTLEEGASIMAASQVSESTLFVGFNRRFDPHFCALGERIRSGVIGELEQLVIISRDPMPPSVEYAKSSGGLFRDMSIHDFDMVRFLTGEDPVEICANGSALFDEGIRDIGDIDTASVLLTMRSGCQVHILNSRRASYGYDQRVEAFGEKGLLRVDNVREHGVEYWSSQGQCHANPEPFFLERYAAAYRAELDYFVDAVLSGEAVQPTALDGLAALLMAEKALESLQLGRPVTIDIGDFEGGLSGPR